MEDHNEVIDQKRRRLSKLKVQQATLGANTRPEITMEIEDIEEEIAAFERQQEEKSQHDACEEQQKSPKPADENTLFRAIKEGSCVLFIGPLASRSKTQEQLSSDLLLKQFLARHADLCDCQFLGGKQSCAGLSCCCHWSLRTWMQYYEESNATKDTDVFAKAAELLEPQIDLYQLIRVLSSRITTIFSVSYDDFLEVTLNDIGITVISSDNDIEFIENLLPIVPVMRHLIAPRYTPFFKENSEVRSRLHGKTLLFIEHDIHQDTFRDLFFDILDNVRRECSIFIVQPSVNSKDLEYWRRLGVFFIQQDAVGFLSGVEQKLREDIEFLYESIQQAAKAFAISHELISRDHMDEIRQKIDILVYQHELTPELKQVLAWSELSLYQTPFLWEKLLLNPFDVELFCLEVLHCDIPVRQDGARLEAQKTALLQAQENAAIIVGIRQIVAASNILLELIIQLRSDNKVAIAASDALAKVGDVSIARILLDHSRDKPQCLKTFLEMSDMVSLPAFILWFFKNNPSNIEQSVDGDLNWLEDHDSNMGIFIQCANTALRQLDDDHAFIIVVNLLLALQYDAAAECLFRFLHENVESGQCLKVIGILGKVTVLQAPRLLGRCVKEGIWPQEAQNELLQLSLNSDTGIRRAALQCLVRSVDAENAFALLEQKLAGSSIDVAQDIVRELNDSFSNQEIFERLVKLKYLPLALKDIFTASDAVDRLVRMQKRYDELFTSGPSENEESLYVHIVELIRQLTPTANNL